jgi:hypothetical protein
VENGDQIIGFFGVVGEYNGKPSATYSSEVVSVSNLYLNYITISSKTNSALIGIVAGYVNGTMTSVGVLHACIKSSNGTKSLMTSLSQTSLIGKSATGVSIQSSYKSSDNNDEEKENGQGFGGSLDMFTLNKRVTYMFGASARQENGSAVKYNKYTYTTINQNYNATISELNNNYMYAVSDSSFSGPTDYTSRNRAYLWGGSYIPLNVDTDKMFTSNISSGQLGSTNNYWYTTDYYTSADNTSEYVLPTNTGYIVAGTYSSESLESVSTAIGAGIAYSTEKNDTYGTIKNSITMSSDYKSISKLDIYYTNGSGSCFIGDNEDIKNSLVRYDAVYEQLKSSFKYYYVDTNKVHAFAYSGFQFQESVATNTRITAKDTAVYLGGNKYSSYQFLASSVNFTLTQTGYITAVVATTLSSDYAGKMFNLYKINRKESGSGNNLTSTISDVTQITKAYVTSSGNALLAYNDSNKKEKIIYKDGDILKTYDVSTKKVTYVDSDNVTHTEDSSDPTTGATLKFSSAWYSADTGKMKGYAMHYVEIPVFSGDYAIGCTNTNAAFFLYLDVGANGSSSEGDKDKDTVTYVVKDVNFVTSLPVGDWSKFPIITIQIDITDALKAAACFYFLRVNNGTDTMYCYYSYGATNLTVKDVDIDESITDVKITNYYSTTDNLYSDVIWTSTTTTSS